MIKFLMFKIISVFTVYRRVTKIEQKLIELEKKLDDIHVNTNKRLESVEMKTSIFFPVGWWQ